MIIFKIILGLNLEIWKLVTVRKPHRKNVNLKILIHAQREPRSNDLLDEHSVDLIAYAAERIRKEKMEDSSSLKV